MKKSDNNFLQPVISVFGLAISVVSTLLPLISKNWLSFLFINEDLIQPISFLAFILGIIIVWQITEFPITQVKVGKWLFSIVNIVWFWVVICITLSFFFFLLKYIVNKNILIWGLLQSLLYLLFFLSLIAAFSFLFLFTRRRYINEADKDNFPYILFETLEKNRLVKPGIEIYENDLLVDREEYEEMSIKAHALVRRMRIKTTPQEEEVIEFIVSHDGRELIKVLKKGK